MANAERLSFYCARAPPRGPRPAPAAAAAVREASPPPAVTAAPKTKASIRSTRCCSSSRHRDHSTSLAHVPRATPYSFKHQTSSSPSTAVLLSQERVRVRHLTGVQLRSAVVALLRLSTKVVPAVGGRRAGKIGRYRHITKEQTGTGASTLLHVASPIGPNLHSRGEAGVVVVLLGLC
jgi:hypothetical protein